MRYVRSIVQDTRNKAVSPALVLRLRHGIVGMIQTVRMARVVVMDKAFVQVDDRATGEHHHCGDHHAHVRVTGALLMRYSVASTRFPLAYPCLARANTSFPTVRAPVTSRLPCSRRVAWSQSMSNFSSYDKLRLRRNLTNCLIRAAVEASIALTSDSILAP
ncbi:hypothetical protein H257_15890 [Aphanomyces astaci]|uniref:Uncharacterized protein n=1 Tax=Aphanomyces astaci TaxID=112090 RepID=W4FL08_APHAT|nr:hypothetical protein H257_15890 [Aphanomyces astaci]ETV68160.1 hypothetical protein H257_15890 [Aphanomyces astaci]|eukprot:XP_009842459.1 hypothetical protein H257_15890 [Aphanomyces astaci]